MSKISCSIRVHWGITLILAAELSVLHFNNIEAAPAQ
jgi:hypothetical protein